MPAFQKGSAEARKLKELFVSGALNIHAKPSQVRDQFITLRHFSTEQFRSGFNKIRKESNEAMDNALSVRK